MATKPKEKQQYRKHYRTTWGETITGLMKRSDDRFCPVGKGNVSFGKDERKAVLRFRQWQAEQRGKEPLTIADINADRFLADALRVDRFIGRFGVDNAETVVRQLPNLTAIFKVYFRDLILTKPPRAATELDVEELRWIGEMKPRTPSLTLKEIGKAYREKRPPISDHWKRKAKLFWGEFCKIVVADKVADLTSDDFAAYHDAILDKATSPTYASHRFGLVKSVLNHALTRGKDIDALERAVTLCKMLKAPRKNGIDPRPIDPDHFAALLDAADVKWKAVLLLALNAALYPSEVAAIEKSHVDLQAGTLVTDRAKTGIVRVAMLWKRTIAAIHEYQAAYPHESPYLFVSQTGNPYDGNHVGRNYRRIRAKAGVPEPVEFAHIRDGAYTAAFNGADKLKCSRQNIYAALAKTKS